MANFRIRQAPSPTGYLHLGTTRQILFTKLFALKEQGTYYLRLEDTDRTRLQKDSARKLLESLSQLYLLPDEGITLVNSYKKYDEISGPDDFYGVYQTGQYGPYIQSQRLPLYHEHSQRLIDKRLAYWSYLTEEEKNELQEIKKINKKPINYFKISLEKSGEDLLFQSVQSGLNDPLKPVLRYRIQRDDKIRCLDELMGQSEFDLNLEEDFIILKSDGFPTYHLAHLVDDYLMETTLVFRAQEWYPSIAKHQTMFLDYWGCGPKYLHIPFILAETGTKKLSKRDGNVNMQDYLDKGYLPEAILNYLAFLGWNPGTEQELYLEPQDFQTLNQERRIEKLLHNISKEFDVSKLSKAPARFSLEKLNWFNREYIKMLTLKEFVFLSDKNRLIQDKTNKARIGDYVYLVDFDEQKVYMTYDERMPGDGLYYPLGGGREGDPIDSLIREVKEESLDQLVLEKDKIMSLENIFINKPFVYHDGESWTGKQMFFYVYPLAITDIKPQKLPDSMNEWFYDWVDLASVIEQNGFIKFSLWQNFCVSNHLPCFEPTEKIIEHYLAYILDKNRITVLSEIGSESDCILYYKPPNLEDLRWKKITIEESQANLEEILKFITTQKPELKILQDRLYQTTKEYIALTPVFTPNFNPKINRIIELERQIKEQITNLINEWENRIKNWLKEGNRDTGSYLWPLRVNLSGKTKSPSPFELLAIKRIKVDEC